MKELWNRIWNAEPVMFITVVLVLAQAAFDAGSANGWTWQTLITAIITAALGLIARQTVYSPKTVDTLLQPPGGTD